MGRVFFTVNLLERCSPLLVEHIDALRNSVREVKQSRPFYLDAWVVLPDHLHTILKLPSGDDDYCRQWCAINKRFPKSIPVKAFRSQVLIDHYQHGIWENTISDDRDYANHLDYIHFNRIKHGWVDAVNDWPVSSFHPAVANGDYPLGRSIKTC